MDTSLGLRRLRCAGARGWILSLGALLFATWVAPAPAEAQKRPRQRAAERRAQASAHAASSAPRLTAPPKIAPSPRPPREEDSPAAAAVLWERAVDALTEAYTERHPDRALEAARGEPGSFALGSFGSPASLRWRDALTDALAGLGRIADLRSQESFAALRRRLADWIQLELLLLDVQAPSSSAPTRYLQRASRTLRATSGALWMRPEPRQRELAGMLAALPEYLRDARINLVAPAPDEIDLALQELEDLSELVTRLTPGLAEVAVPKGQSAPPGGLDPGKALAAFRAWLLELRASAGGEPPRLEPDEWQRCLQLATGTNWHAGELKARTLRELARLDLGRLEKQRERLRRPAAEELATQVAAAAEGAARLGLGAHVLRDSLKPGRLEFRSEVSPRAAWHELALQPAPGGHWIGTLALPHPAWSAARTASRHAALRLENAAALGVRHGLAGEAYWASLLREQRERGDVPPMLLDERLVREGLGLYALEWTSRIPHPSSPFAGEAITRAFARQRGREAARLLAALELHAEGLSQGEAVLNFQRRTGADEESALAEIRAALRDPLHGIAYLGLLEILALEQRLTGLVEPSKVARVVLLLLGRNPGLRPGDLALEPEPARNAAGSEEKATVPLEISGPPQQEQPRSR